MVLQQQAIALDSVTITAAPTGFKEYMERRDENMTFKCQQMMDCDNDRRDFAQKQTANLAARREGKPLPYPEVDGKDLNKVRAS